MSGRHTLVVIAVDTGHIKERHGVLIGADRGFSAIKYLIPSLLHCQSMRCVTIVRTFVVRGVFCCHGFLSVWRLYMVMNDARYWCLLLTIAFLLMETVIIVYRNGGKEWKWFCPSVLIYLLSVVPSIWFLELHEMEYRIMSCQNITNLEQCAGLVSRDRHTYDAVFKNIQMVDIVPDLTADQWIRALEQLLLLILIVCRWLMPKGKLTHDQLSQLLLVYIGTAADIVEFFDAFKEIEVKFNRVLCIAILGIWSLSLIQFCLVLTAAKARQDKSGLLRRRKVKDNTTCFQADVFAIIISILLQDVPFLVFRMILIFKYSVLSYTNMFFTSKNTLVILLLMYRLVVVHLHRSKEHEPDISAPYDGRLSSLELRDNIAGSEASSTKSQMLLNTRASISTDSIHRLNCNSYRSAGLLKSVPRAWTHLGNVPSSHNVIATSNNRWDH